MTEPGAQSRWRRFCKYLLLTALAGVLLISGLAWYTTTDSFQSWVRHRLVAELERMTGGRVELREFHTVPLQLRVEIRGLTIHGLESANDIPYAHVERLVAQMKLISAIGAEIGFSSLVLDRPIFHVVIYPDGTTNQPAPQSTKTSTRTSMEQFLSLSIGRLEVRQGELLWNDHKTPLDFIANDVSVNMDYSLLHHHYDGSLLLGKVSTAIGNYRPVAWMAEVHFTLGDDGIEVSSLTASSGRSRVQASGQVHDFRQPTVEAKYEITLDLGEAGSIVRRPEIRQGVLHATGEGSWSLATFSSIGKLEVKNLDWRDKSAALRAVTLRSDYTFDSNRLTLSQIQARMLGGEVSGDAEVVNWRSPPGTTAKSNASAEQKGTVRLRVSNLAASDVAAALSSSSRPLERMNLAGNVSGTIEAKWKGSVQNAETAFALDAIAPVQVTPAQLPLNARAHATYRAAGEELEVTEFTLSTRTTQVRATGRLSSSSALNLSVTTSDLGEWQPVLTDLGYQERIPVFLHGHATFNGTATGKMSAIAFAGKLQSEDFDLMLPATRRVSAKHVHFDSLVADIELSPRAVAVHHARLHHGETTIRFDVTASLQERRFTDSSPFTAHVEVRGGDVDELQALLGYDFPVSGSVNLSAQAQGTKAEPRGSGHIELAGAVIRGQAVQELDSKFEFSHDEIALNDLHLTFHEARINGAGAYSFSTRAFRFNLDGNNFDLAGIPQLQTSRVSVEGRMDFTAQASGTLDEPAITANIRLHDLTFDHERVGDYTLDAVTQGSELRLTGHSQFREASLDIDGNVHLRGDLPASVALHFSHLDVDPVLRTYLKGRVTGHSAADGELRLQGPLRKPGELEITGNLSDFFADVENIKLRNSGPIRFAVFNQTLKLQQFHLIGDGTDLTVGGTVQLDGDRQLDLRAQGHANLQLLESYNPDFATSGEVAVDLTVGGIASKPTMQGRLQIAGGSIAYSDLPSALSGINGSLAFNQDRLQIETLTAHVGGGLVTFGGYATAYNRQLNFNLTMQTQDVRLRYPPGVSSMANANLRWAGTSTASVLSGDITITRLAVTPGFDFGASLASSPGTAVLPQANPLLNRIRMDVHIVTTPELQMQTASIRLTGDADLRLQGTAARPVLLGRADIAEGEIRFNGTKYRLERGDISFTNPVTISPVLDLQASTRVRDYDITLNLTGSLDKLNLTYRSEPPLPVADIISLLALGQTQQQSAQSQGSGGSPFAQQASSAILAEALNSAMSTRSRSLFGISHIKIDPQGLNNETSPTTTSPAVTIEQQVEDNLTVTYTTNVSQTSQQIIQVQYNLTRNVSILGLRDYNGVVSFEVRIRQRKK
jgi:translocation and assembly module TamB